MKKICAVTWALALFTIMLPVAAGAAVADPSHFGLAIGINCNTCHTSHRTLGSNRQGQNTGAGVVRPSPAAYNNMCQSCHRTGDGFAKAKPMALVDTSAIFGQHSTENFGKLRETSHRWDGNDINPAAGAQVAIQPAMTTNTNGVYNLRGRSGNELACVRCHSPHLAGAPGAMLRLGVENNQLCRDCHRSRDTQTHLTGSHPIGINYDTAAAKGNFNNPPLNANASNPTSDLGNYFTKGGMTAPIPLAPSVAVPDKTIVCTTCHGVHYTDSKSSTFDGASTVRGKGNYTNLSTGDGYQLRTDRRGAKVAAGQQDKLNLCTNCHANKKSHNANDQDIQCNDCHGAHVEYDADDPNNTKGTNVYLIRRNVTKGSMPSKIFFRYTGSNKEYKNAEGTGVCQGCHNVPEAGGKYPAEHDSNKASDCVKCHSHSNPAGSFSGACGKCHGNPPTIATPGPGGLALPATNALGGAVGAHGAHVANGLRMECNTCHDGYANRVMPNTTIDLGFAINGVNVPGFTNVPAGGTYNNTNALANGYVFTGSVGTGANQTCTNIYCHGSTLTGGNNTTPSWVGGNGQVTCGSCHGASAANPPTAGSHARHAGAAAGQLQIPCASCHGATAITHVNGNVKWNLVAVGGQYKTPSGKFYNVSGTTGRLAPSARYGTCNNLYCHSNSGPNGAAVSYNTVTWGGAAMTCGSCHANMASIASGTPNGGHYKHASSTNTNGPAYDCSVCHSGYTATSTNGATHANRLVELIAAVTGYSKAAPINAGSTWGTCTNQCHGQAAAISWNNATIYFDGTDHCSTCHSSPSGVTAGTPFYSTKYPGKTTANTDAKVGAHTYHVTKLTMMSASLICSDCHGPVALKDANHMNGTTNFVWSASAKYNNANPSYDPLTGKCSNVYCHGDALPYADKMGTNRIPTWNTPFMPATLTLPASCNGCHGFPPSAATGHPVVAGNLTTCKVCHSNVNDAATGYADVFVNKALHINGQLEGGKCNSCHGYPPANKRFTGSAGNYEFAGMENYSGGGGAHTVAGHVSPTANVDDQWVNCSKCHNPNDHTTSPVVFMPSNNIKVTIDPKYKFNAERKIRYTSNGLDGAAHVSGSCMNVSCHYQKTPKW